VILLDTDTLTYLHEGHPRVLQRLQNSDDPEIAVTVISKVEMLRGRFDFLLKAATGAEVERAARLLVRTEDLLAQLPIIRFDTTAAVQFDRLRLLPSVRKIGRADLLIASITLANRAILVTRNQRHFQQVPGLRIVNWID
jgi:tRNA(fMet)-specific endonuclease VapC